MDVSGVAVFMCIGAAALALRFFEMARSPRQAMVTGPRSRTWTSSLSIAEAGAALMTVGERIGYSMDRERAPGLMVLADGALAGSYGQHFPVSLTTSGRGTVVRIGIVAKDPALALADAVQERRLESLARTTRAVFADAEEDARRLFPEGRTP